MNLRDALQAIYDQEGFLTPGVVVDYARDQGHPLHRSFEWNDRVAGEAYRRHQAQELIQSVKVVYKTDQGTGKEHTVRAYVSVKTPEHGFIYEKAETVAKNPVLVRVVMNDMERDWQVLKARYEGFAEFWQLVQADVVGAIKD